MKRSIQYIILILVVLIITIRLASAGYLIWKDEPFNEKFNDADVSDVLQSIARRNGVNITIKEGVKGSVTRSFVNIPLQTAFNMMLEQFALQFDWNPDEDYLIVFSKAGEKKPNYFIHLKGTTIEFIKNTLKKFDLLLSSFIFDEETNTVFLKGPADKISSALTIIEELEKAATIKDKREFIHLKTTSTKNVKETLVRIGLWKNTFLEDAATASFLLDGSSEEIATASKVIHELDNNASDMMDKSNKEVFFKIIPLQYATAGPTTIIIQEEKVTVPGIEDTIMNLLPTITKSENKIPKENDAQEKTTPSENSFNLLPSKKPLQKTDKKTVQNEDVTISIDSRTNSVIVSGKRDVVEKVEKLVKELDKPIPMVELQVIIIETTKDFVRNLGLDWSQSKQSGHSEYSIGTGTWSANSLNTFQTSAQTPRANLPGNSPAISFIYNGPSGFLSSQLTAMESEGKGKVLAAPRVVTLDNRQCIIKSGQDTPVKIVTQIGYDVKTLNSGIILTVTPHIIRPINPSDSVYIRLSISAERSAFTLDFSADGIPGKTTRTITTEVIIPHNSTFTLGGMFDRTTSDSVSGVPILKDIPLLGLLFGTKSKTLSESELVIFVTPKIISMNQLEIQSKLSSTLHRSDQLMEGNIIPNIVTKSEQIMKIDKEILPEIDKNEIRNINQNMNSETIVPNKTLKENIEIPQRRIDTGGIE